MQLIEYPGNLLYSVFFGFYIVLLYIITAMLLYVEILAVAVHYCKTMPEMAQYLWMGVFEGPQSKGRWQWFRRFGKLTSSKWPGGTKHASSCHVNETAIRLALRSSCSCTSITTSDSWWIHYTGWNATSTLYGPMIGNIFNALLVIPGISMVWGGLAQKEQISSARSAGVTRTMLMFSLIGVFAPFYNKIYGATELTCHKECAASYNGSMDAASCFQCYFMQKLAYSLTLSPVEISSGKMLRVR